MALRGLRGKADLLVHMQDYKYLYYMPLTVGLILCKLAHHMLLRVGDHMPQVFDLEEDLLVATVHGQLVEHYNPSPASDLVVGPLEYALLGI